MSSLIPSSPGLLPYWLLITSILSIFNTIACYTSPSFFLARYSNPFPNSPPSKPTPFSSLSKNSILPARIFGTWTLITCILRTYAAYALDKPDIYLLTLSTYITALGHFLSEWLYYKTMNFKGVAPSLFFSTTTMTWMVINWGSY